MDGGAGWAYGRSNGDDGPVLGFGNGYAGAPVGAGRAGSEVGGSVRGSVSELGSPVVGGREVGRVSPLGTGGGGVGGAGAAGVGVGNGAVQHSAGLFGGEYPPGVYEVDSREAVGHARGMAGGEGAGVGASTAPTTLPTPARNIHQLS